MKTLPIDRPTLDDPLYSQKNPHQTFLLGFSLFSATPLIFGHSAGSGTLSQRLSPNMVLLWGACLFAGSGIALVGQYWRGHTWTGLVLERAGLALVGIGALIWAVVLFWSVKDHESVRYAVSINMAYALSCFWRCGQIHARLRYIRQLVAEVNARHG